MTTGGGGWVMLNPEQTNRQATWQPLTAKFIATQRSFTIMDVGADRLRLEQIGEFGEVLDSFTVRH